MKGKDIIKLEYVEKGVVYQGEIDKSNFVNQMEHMVKWYSDCNEKCVQALCPASVNRIYSDKPGYHRHPN